MSDSNEPFVPTFDDYHRELIAARKAAKTDAARLVVSQNALATAQALMKASITALKESDGNAAAKSAAVAAINVVRAARQGVEEVQGHLDESQYAADMAKADFAQKLASLTVRGKDRVKIDATPKQTIPLSQVPIGNNLGFLRKASPSPPAPEKA